MFCFVFVFGFFVFFCVFLGFFLCNHKFDTAINSTYKKEKFRCHKKSWKLNFRYNLAMAYQIRIVWDYSKFMVTAISQSLEILLLYECSNAVLTILLFISCIKDNCPSFCFCILGEGLGFGSQDLRQKLYCSKSKQMAYYMLKMKCQKCFQMDITVT